MVQPQLRQRATKWVGKERPSRDCRTNEPSGPVLPEDDGTKRQLPGPLLPLLVPSALNRRIAAGSPFHHGSVALQPQGRRPG